MPRHTINSDDKEPRDNSSCHLFYAISCMYGGLLLGAGLGSTYDERGKSVDNLIVGGICGAMLGLAFAGFSLVFCGQSEKHEPERERRQYREVEEKRVAERENQSAKPKTRWCDWLCGSSKEHVR